MTTEPEAITAVDSLSAHEFNVEINGEIVTGVFSVSGISTRCVNLEQQKLVYKPLTITKMVQQDPSLPFNEWTRETLANPTTKVVRELAVVAMDEQVETRRWVCKNAWISCIDFSDFDTSSDILIEEKLTIQHNGIIEKWPGDEAPASEASPEEPDPEPDDAD